MTVHLTSPNIQDRYVVVRSPDLVSQFTNTPPICMPPQFVEAHFFKSSETAGQVFRGLVSLDDRKAREAYLASCFATFLAPSEVGLCSDAHDKSMWELGYCAEQTIYFQHMYVARERDCLSLNHPLSGTTACSTRRRAV
jgi:hypothetical protein